MKLKFTYDLSQKAKHYILVKQDPSMSVPVPVYARLVNGKSSIDIVWEKKVSNATLLSIAEAHKLSEDLDVKIMAGVPFDSVVGSF